MTTITTPSVLATNVLGFLGNFGMMEWAVILVIALLLFGRRLPEVGRSMGQGIREFKKGLKETEEDARKESTNSNQRASLPNGESMPSNETSRERSQTH